MKKKIPTIDTLELKLNGAQNKFGGNDVYFVRSVFIEYGKADCLRHIFLFRSNQIYVEIKY